MPEKYFYLWSLNAQHLTKRNSDISSFNFKEGKIKRQFTKTWLKLTYFQHNLFKLLTMKVLCHYNSRFWIFPRVLHIQTNQPQKYHHSKIHFSGVTYGALTSRTGDGRDMEGRNKIQHYADFKPKSTGRRAVWQVWSHFKKSFLFSSHNWATVYYTLGRLVIHSSFHEEATILFTISSKDHMFLQLDSKYRK